MVPKNLIAVCVLLIVTTLNSCWWRDDFEIPKPSIDDKFIVPQIGKSSLNIPISINLTPLVAELENNIPRQQGSGVKLYDGDNGYSYDAVRDNLSTSVNGNTLSISTQVHYQAEYCKRVKKPWPLSGYICPIIASCGYNEPRPTVNIGLNSIVTLNEDWYINSKTTSMPITSIRDCKVTIFNYNVTSKIIEKFQPIFDGYVATIDQKMPQVTNIKAKADDLWKKLQAPIKVKEDIWFAINPDTFSVSSLNGSGQTLNLNVGLKCIPKIIYGKTIPTTEKKDLPKLKINDSSTAGFHIELEGEVPFDEANTTANAKLKDRKYPLGKFSVEIKDIQLYAAGQNIIAQVKVGGSAKGTIYFIGTPYYDALNKIIKIRNFDYSIETKNILAKSANWLLHEDFKKSINSQLAFSVAKQIDDGKQSLQQALNKQIQPTIRLEGNVANIIPLGVYNTATSLKAIVVADGDVKVQVQ